MEAGRQGGAGEPHAPPSQPLPGHPRAPRRAGRRPPQDHGLHRHGARRRGAVTGPGTPSWLRPGRWPQQSVPAGCPPGRMAEGGADGAPRRQRRGLQGRDNGCKGGVLARAGGGRGGGRRRAEAEAEEGRGQVAWRPRGGGHLVDAIYCPVLLLGRGPGPARVGFLILIIPSALAPPPGAGPPACLGLFPGPAFGPVPALRPWPPAPSAIPPLTLVPSQSAGLTGNLSRRALHIPREPRLVRAHGPGHNGIPFPVSSARQHTNEGSRLCSTHVHTILLVINPAPTAYITNKYV